MHIYSKKADLFLAQRISSAIRRNNIASFLGMPAAITQTYFFTLVIIFIDLF